ncbi:MAG: hypothetical protein J5937_06250 [Paludibacteraceae bacterium]|nr:hypothetical protein [Paludibacteraceae bacterium]
MASVTPASPFESISGKLSRNERIVMRTRNGRMHAYAIQNPYTGPLAESRKKAISAFAEAVKQCKVEMEDAERLAYWQEQYAEYKQLANKNLNRANRRFFGENSNAAAQDKFYSTLRGFIIAQLRKTAE